MTLEEIVEEFLEKQRDGERPTPQQYADLYPELRDDILATLPPLALLEQVKEESLSNEIDRSQSWGAPPDRIGDYEIISEVGRGGMGVVYEADQLSLGRRVAIKLLPPSIAVNERALMRFKREARAAARMHHSNIVPVFEVGEDNGHVFYAMQLIHGPGLNIVIDELRRADRTAAIGSALPNTRNTKLIPPLAGSNSHDFGSTSIDSQKKNSRSEEVLKELSNSLSENEPDDSRPDLSSQDSEWSSNLTTRYELSDDGSKNAQFFRQIARIGFQVADALGYAHARGIIHRDIKPANLLLDSEGVVWVTDFGLAKSQDETVTRTGDLLGTLRYMSPERFNGKCDTRADIYSLGLTLYELVVQRPAFGTTSHAELVEQITKTDPPAPRSIRRQIPTDLEVIILKAIDKDPARRYQDADDMAEDLSRFINDEPIRARRISLLRRWFRWRRRNKELATAVTAIAALVLLVVMASPIAYLRESILREDAERLQQSAESARLAAERTNKISNRNLYFAQMNLAGQAAQQAGGVSRISDLTALWKPNRGGHDHRGWEWYYLKSLCDRELQTQTVEAQIWACCWSPDDTAVALACSDRALRIWNTKTDEVRVIAGHRNQIHATSWSPNGEWIATGSVDNTVRIFDAETGEEIERFKHKDHVFTVGWHPTKPLLASGSRDKTIRIWDVEAGKRIRQIEGHIGSIQTLDWSPDGTMIVTGSWDKSIRIWNAETGAEQPVQFNHERSVYCVRWSPDGTRVASTSTDGTTRVWDVVGEKELWSAHTTTQVWNVAWSPDGTQLLTGSADRALRVRDASNGDQVRMLDGHTNQIWGVAWSHDGTRLASVSHDKTVRLWEATPANENRAFQLGLFNIGLVAWSPIGDQLAMCETHRQIQLRDARDAVVQQNVTRHDSLVRSIAWRHDGLQLASSSWDGTVIVWDIEAQEVFCSLKFHRGVIHSVAWSPDGKSLASASHDRTIKLWDIESESLIRVFKNHRTIVDCVTWHPDGDFIASSGHDGRILLWEAKTGNVINTMTDHNGAVVFVGWSPDGTRLASASADSTVILWSSDGSKLSVLKGHVGPVLSLGWSPDGARLATSSEDGTVKLWDPDTGIETLTMKGHQSAVTCVEWSPDGTQLISVDRDGGARIWDASLAYRRERPQGTNQPPIEGVERPTNSTTE